MASAAVLEGRERQVHDKLHSLGAVAVLSVTLDHS